MSVYKLLCWRFGVGLITYKTEQITKRNESFQKGHHFVFFVIVKRTQKGMS